MALESPVSVLYNSEGIEVTLSQTQEITGTQPGLMVAGSSSLGATFFKLDDDGSQFITGDVGITGPVTVDGTVDVGNIVVGGANSAQIVNQGEQGTIAESWFVQLTDGTAAVGTEANPLAVSGALEAVISDTITVTGSVTLDGQPIETIVTGVLETIVNNTVNVTGTVAIEEPVEVTGSVAITTDAALEVFTSGTTDVNVLNAVTVTGSVTLGEQPIDTTVTGVLETVVNNTVEVTGTVAIEEPVSITTDSPLEVFTSGTSDVNITNVVTVTGSVALAEEPIEVTGSVETTISGTIMTREACSDNATVTAVSASTANQTALVANSTRTGAVFFMDGGSKAFIKLGATASETEFTVRLTNNGYYELPKNYCGQVDVVFNNNNPNSELRITEITE